MPVRQLRRLGPATGDSLLDQVRARTFHWAPIWRAEVDATEAKHPELIVRDETNILAAVGMPHARLIYGFDSDRAFGARFPAMFEKLLPRLRKSLAAETVRLRLDYAPARPLVEPILRSLAFEPRRDWIEFSLDRSAKPALTPVPRGVRFRPATPEDLDDLLRIDAESFPDSPIDPQSMANGLARESVLLAISGGATAGFCMFAMPNTGEGWISILATRADQRGAGIGTALTARACKQLFAGGARRVRLTTDDDNGGAIRLYVRLGFKQSAAGRDYSRPTDARAIERMRKQGDGIVIRFGGWR